MPTPAFCALDEAYGDWTTQEVANPNIIVTDQKAQKTQKDGWDMSLRTPLPDSADKGIRSFCPNCKNCVNADNILQQKIIEQNIWPRPRWVPQDPYPNNIYDPFNRTWANFQAPKEEFGTAAATNTSASAGFLQLVLVVLVVLFLIQLLEMIANYA